MAKEGNNNNSNENEALDLDLVKKCSICPQKVASATNLLSLTNDDEVFLYDPEVVKKLDFTQTVAKFHPQVVSPSNLGEGLAVRPLSNKDYDRGFLDILGQLTTVGTVTKEQFLTKFDRMKSCPDTYYVTVIVDTKTDKIIGSGTLVHEQKFIHDCGSRGIIEDIIVNSQYRGKQLGKIIITSLVEIGKAIGCYKITLNCKDDLVKFYNSFGFICEPGNDNFMQIRIPSKL